MYFCCCSFFLFSHELDRRWGKMKRSDMWYLEYARFCHSFSFSLPSPGICAYMFFSSLGRRIYAKFFQFSYNTHIFCYNVRTQFWVREICWGNCAVVAQIQKKRRETKTKCEIACRLSLSSEIAIEERREKWKKYVHTFSANVSAVKRKTHNNRTNK